ncbi:MAG: hypothetical protein M1514_00300, partial [Patescibacteria group bacterium]|nr:hypothetical protein [Patescibacteria group bacterium]
ENVIKRIFKDEEIIDGSLEDFDRSKILNGVVKAGGSPEEAEKVASEIEAWLPTAAIDGIVNSMMIREKGLALLQAVNPGVATTFAEYKKPVCAGCQTA